LLHDGKIPSQIVAGEYSWEIAEGMEPHDMCCILASATVNVEKGYYIWIWLIFIQCKSMWFQFN
jgi:hypothetical protein